MRESGHMPVMILDEPTAALSNAEKKILFEQVRVLKTAGVSFMYISHHLDEIFEIADTVTIMRDGEVVKARAAVSSLDVEMIADIMMGEKTVRSVREDHTQHASSPLLDAKEIRVDPKCESVIDFKIKPGEIVALAGPVGGGKEALAMILSGQVKPESGTIISSRINFPTIGLVPTDRHASGYVGILGVRENVALGGLEMLSGMGGADRGLGYGRFDWPLQRLHGGARWTKPIHFNTGLACSIARRGADHLQWSIDLFSR
jgi:ABC-type sugar transport system ATPase subunit